MNISTYREKISEIARGCDDMFFAKTDYQLEARYHIISASLSKLMPTLPEEQHLRTIRDINFFQDWAAVDQHLTGLLDHIEEEGNIPDWNQITAKPVIFCSYHTGSYRLTIPYLIKQGLKITMLADEHVAREQGQSFHTAANAAKARYGREGDYFDLINTAQDNMIYALLRALKQGRSLMIFVDGNTGVDGRSTNAEKLEMLEFFGEEIFARKGVGFISYLSKAQVIPLISYRAGADFMQNRLHFEAGITRAPGDSRDSYVRRVLQSTYGILQSNLKTIFAQWESWRYIDKSMRATTLAPDTLEIDAEVINGDAPLTFNRRRYAIFRAKEGKFALFDRSCYCSVIIGSAFKDFLLSLNGQTLSMAATRRHPSMSDVALLKLLSKEILVMH